MSHPHNTNHVRRVVLPSGRAIEVVYYESRPAQIAEPQVDRPAERIELHVCPECAKELVYPVRWSEASATHWEVELRCPNCEWRTVDLYDQETVDRFDEELDRAAQAVARDFNSLTRANMEEETERFANALASDAIWPMDF